LKTQAAHVTHLLTIKNEEAQWKIGAETSIKRVQQAGNQLEERVGRIEKEVEKDWKYYAEELKKMTS
jgi:hypothetical protein